MNANTLMTVLFVWLVAGLFVTIAFGRAKIVPDDEGDKKIPGNSSTKAEPPKGYTRSHPRKRMVR